MRCSEVQYREGGGEERVFMEKVYRGVVSDEK